MRRRLETTAAVVASRTKQIRRKVAPEKKPPPTATAEAGEAYGPWLLALVKDLAHGTAIET